MNLMPFETERIQPPWQRVIQSLITSNHLFGEEVKGENESLMGHLWLHRVYTLEYLTKIEWDNTIQPHTPHGSKHSYKPLAELWRRVVVACDRLYSWYSYLLTEYATVADWFASIYVELAIEGISSNQGKKHDVEIMASQNKQLKSFENPFSLAATPETYRFVDLLIKRSESSNDFKKEVFTPFLQSRANLIKVIKTSSIISIRESDKGVFLARSGKGNSYSRLEPKFWGG